VGILAVRQIVWTTWLKPGWFLPAPVGLVELFVAVLIVGISAINAAVPLMAWSRARDSRFLLLAMANGVIALLGAVWTWGQLPGNPPSYAVIQLPVLGIVLTATSLLLATTLWPRHA